MSNKFLFIATGGTIEFVAGQSQTVKHGEFETTYQPPNFREESIIPQHLKTHHPDLEYDFHKVCMKDAKDVSVTDLLAVERHISESDCKHIIITHGTDKMVENSQMLEKWLKNTEKTVTFVGAFRPLEDLQSDGIANIKLAIAEAANLAAGVYISGSGKVHKCQEVVKDFDRKEFVSR